MNDREAHDALAQRADHARKCGCWQHDDEHQREMDIGDAAVITLCVIVVCWAVIALLAGWV